MKANDKKVVSLIYQLEVAGEIKDSCTRENPLEFIFGAGTLLPKFEANVKDKEPGDKFDFILSPEEGYGVYDPEALVDLPKSCFEIEGKVNDDILFAGNVIPMMTNDGRVVRGVVKEISDTVVKMDFNHELAGATLHFTGEIVGVREATEKELTEGLHGEFAHNCSGNCSECGGGCH